MIDMMLITITAGGDVPNPLDELMPPPQKQSSTTRSEAQPILPSLPQDIHQDILHAPVRQNSIGSGAWSTVATPGLREENDVEMAFAGATPDDPPRSGMDLDKSQGDKPTDSPSQRKNVRFAGPDGAPLSPAGTFVSLDSYVSPGGPPPTVFGDLNEKQGANTSGMTGTFMDDESRDEASAPTIAVTGKPLPSAPSLIPSPSTQTERGVASAVVPTPTANTVFTASTNEVINLDSKSIEICQKHCKWAISALDYEDMDTARAELRKALAMLGG
jgi:vacuolar protein sorting-associated protein VTA1